MPWLTREIGQLRHAGLHAIGHLVLGDARLDLGIGDLVVVQAIEGAEVVELATADRIADAGRVRQIEHRVAIGAQLDSLVARRQKSGAPVIVVEDLPARQLAVLRGHDHERRQVLIHAAQAIAQPRAHARPARLLGAGEEERHRRGVVDRVGAHRANDADIVGDGARVRQKVAEPLPAAAPLAEAGDPRQHKLALALRHGRQTLPHLHRRRQQFAAPPGQARLVIEQVHVRRGAGLHQVNDAAHLRCEVRQAGQRAGALTRQIRGGAAIAEQIGERGDAERAASPSEKLAAGEL